MADTTTFAYAALPENNIRLLYVFKDEKGEIFCELKDVNLDPAPKFIALSYVWGSGSADEVIICNSVPLKITPNLHEAIRTLYLPLIDSDLPVWIDALCINQQDDEEKSVHVARMGDVYSKAYQVVAWLGPSGQDSDTAMDSLNLLNQVLPTMIHPPNPAFAPSPNTLANYGLPDESDSLWPALGHLYRRSWFGRLWTFQEAVLAQDLLLVCGQKLIDWDIVATVAHELNRLRIFQSFLGYKGTLGLHEDGFRAMENVRLTKKALSDYGGLRFPTLLMIADTKLCTDPRDRVYAMLGLTSDSFRDRISVSYAGKTKDESSKVYLDCAKACIEEEGFVPLILQLVTGRSRAPGLPSWCPNLNSNQGTIFPFDNYLHAGIPSDYYDSDWKPSYAPAWTTPGSNILSITGFRVDVVSEIVDGTFHWPMVPDEQEISRTHNFLDWESRCLKLAQKAYQSSPGQIPIGHIYTLTANTRGRLLEASENDLRQAFQDLLVHLRAHFRDKYNEPVKEDRVALLGDSWKQMYFFCTGRRYFSTTGGLVGLGPPGMMSGDSVCVLYGTRPVFVLRELKGKDASWSLVGDAYLHSKMELGDISKEAQGVEGVFNIA